MAFSTLEFHPLGFLNTPWVFLLLLFPLPLSFLCQVISLCSGWKKQAPRSGPSLFFKCAHCPRGLLLYSSMALQTPYVLALGCLPPIWLCFFSLTCSKQNSQPPHLSQKATPPFSWLKMIKPWDSSQHFSSYNTHKILVILPWKLNQKSGHLCC